jgi:glycosyltransferase involved in cell wall biosynthesis
MTSNGRSHIVAERESRAAPHASVIVSLYNYGHYVTECLESVRAQTLEDLDLIVVDDCSTDGGGDEVVRWLETAGERFNRYRLLRHAQNEGLASARNAAFAHARTEFVFVLDADNVLYPRCVQQLVTALRLSQADFAYCYVEKFGEAVGLHNVRAWDPARLHSGNAIDAMVLLRRSVWEAVGGYSRDMPSAGWEDFDLWFRIARNGGWGVQVPEILARYRVHGQSMLANITNPNADRLWEYLRSTYPEFFPKQNERLL